MSSCSKICENFPSLAKYRVVVQSPNNSSDDYGGFTAGWTTQSTVWGYITHATASEIWRSEQLQSRVSHKIYIRYQSALKDTKTVGGYRITYDSRTFQVIGVKNLDRSGKYEGTDYQVFEVIENEAGN